MTCFSSGVEQLRTAGHSARLKKNIKKRKEKKTRNWQHDTSFSSGVEQLRARGGPSRAKKKEKKKKKRGKEPVCVMILVFKRSAKRCTQC
jgi:hypothetical protein